MESGSRHRCDKQVRSPCARLSLDFGAGERASERTFVSRVPVREGEGRPSLSSLPDNQRLLQMVGQHNSKHGGNAFFAACFSSFLLASAQDGKIMCFATSVKSRKRGKPG